MNLEQLLHCVHEYPLVTDDTRELVPGAVFVAGGGRALALAYLQQAIALDAALIVCEDSISVPAHLPCVRVVDRCRAAADLACAFYGHPSRHLTTLGVTGTCGKTTSTYLLEAILGEAGHQVGVIGTENIRYAGQILPSPNTTPSPFVLQRTLANMLAAGCTAAVMEVSSHALEQQRTKGVCFDGAIFTNLSTEHLDLHGDMPSYFEAKALLFTEYAEDSASAGKRFCAAVSIADYWGELLYERLGSRCGTSFTLSPFALRSRESLTVNGAGLRVDHTGINGAVDSLAVRSSLLGEFNGENILGAIALGRALDITEAAISAGIAALKCVPGRMEQVATPDDISVVVDFAHKPGALEVVLATLRSMTRGRLIAVIGCGGARDRAKRPVMGSVAARGADRVIITSDNARGEAPAQIADQILRHCSTADHVTVCLERRAAIACALAEAAPGDVVLIAGRGTEAELNVLLEDGSSLDVSFDDRVVARELAQERAAGILEVKP